MDCFDVTCDLGHTSNELIVCLYDVRFGTCPQWTWECCLGVYVACLTNREGGLDNVGLGHAHIGLVMCETVFMWPVVLM